MTTIDINCLGRIVVHGTVTIKTCKKKSEIYDKSKANNLGPVVQSIVSLTTSLRRQLVKKMPTKFSHTLLFFVEKM